MGKILLLAVFLALPAAAAEAPSPVSAVSAQTQPARQRGNRFLEFYVPQIILAAVALIAASEGAARKYPQSRRVINKFWVWTLLVSLLACAAFGLFLLVPLDKPVKVILEHLHVWNGALCLAAGIYHSIRRMRAIL